MIKIFFIFSCILLFFPSYSKPVIEITTENFDNYSSYNETDNVVIMFFDPNCKFCQKVKPEFIKAGEVASEKLDNVLFGTANLEQQYMLGHKNVINYVPSIRLLRKGIEGYTEIKYYSSSEIINYLFRMFHLHTYELKTGKEVADFIRNYETVAFYYGSEKDEEFRIFKEYLELHENVQITFGHIFKKEIIDDMKLDPIYKIAILRKENDEDFIYFKDTFTLIQLVEFLKVESFPLINKFDQKMMNEIFKSINPLLVLLKKPNQKKNERLDTAFKAACGDIRSKIRCCSVFSDSDFASPLMEKLGISEADLPQVRIIQGTNENNLTKHKPSIDAIDKENLLKFVNEYFNGKAIKYYRTESIPVDSKEPIKKVVRENYDLIVKSNQFDVLVEFYAPWCNHCEKAENLMKSISSKLKKVKNLIFARIDFSKNDIDEVVIEELPHILFYPSDDKQNPIRYSNDLDYSSLISFLKLHTTVDTKNTILQRTDQEGHQEL